jgi:hypothetical protein
VGGAIDHCGYPLTIAAAWQCFRFFEQLFSRRAERVDARRLHYLG